MTQPQKHEIRYQYELRKSASRTLKGYASKFHSRSLDLGGFFEEMEPGCFSECLSMGDEIRALVDHDPTKILARRSNGSLRISEDAVGLAVEFDVPTTSWGNDLLACVDAGLIAGMSFRMAVIADRWENLTVDGKASMLRRVVTASVDEVTATSQPAYTATSLAARAYFPEGTAHIEARIATVREAGVQNGNEMRRLVANSLLKEIQEEDMAAADDSERNRAAARLRIAIAKLQ
jgi:HK97 family phage prohead protease